MEKLNFTIDIVAPAKKVWNILFNETTYQKWTSVFAEGSYAVTDWKEGSKALFLTAQQSGLVSMIAKNVPNEFMSIKHLGFVNKGVEDLDSDEVKSWAGALENYTLKESGGVTKLSIEMDSVIDYKDYFTEKWPQALEKVKELSE